MRRQRQYDDFSSSSYSSNYYQQKQQHSNNFHLQRQNQQYNNNNNNNNHSQGYHQRRSNSQNFTQQQPNYNDSQSFLDEIFGPGKHTLMKRRSSSRSNPASPTLNASKNNNNTSPKNQNNQQQRVKNVNRQYKAPILEEDEQDEGNFEKYVRDADKSMSSNQNKNKNKNNKKKKFSLDEDGENEMFNSRMKTSSSSFSLDGSNYTNDDEEEIDSSNSIDPQRLEKLVLQLTPTPQECNRRFSAFCELRDVLKKRLGVYIYVFGSQRTGIALPSSDVDVVVRAHPLKTSSLLGNPDAATDTDDEGFEEQSPRSQRQQQHHQRNNNHKTRTGLGDRFGDHNNNHHRNRSAPTPSTRNKKEMPPFFEQVLRVVRQDHRFYDIKPIVHAKVPIIKLRHRQTQIEMDITFQDDGLDSSRYLSRQFDLCKNEHNEPARGLVVLMKAFMAGLGMNDPARKGVGSFVCSMLVLWYLNFRRRGSSANDKDEVGDDDDQEEKQEEENIDGIKKKKSLEDFFVDLLRFYCYEFDTMRYAVDCSTWSAFEKHVSQDLTLLNPLEKSRNCSSAAGLFIPAVLPAMESLYEKIQAEYKKKGKASAAAATNSSSPFSSSPPPYPAKPTKKDKKKNKKNKNNIGGGGILSSPPLSAVAATGEIVEEDSLPNWILFPKIYVLGTASIIRGGNNNMKRRKGRMLHQQQNNNFYLSQDDNDYLEHEYIVDRDYDGGYEDASAMINFYDEDGKNLFDEKTGRRIPKTLAWTRRWDSLENLKQNVSNVPTVDAEGFYCALSV